MEEESDFTGMSLTKIFPLSGFFKELETGVFPKQKLRSLCAANVSGNFGFVGVGMAVLMHPNSLFNEFRV